MEQIPQNGDLWLGRGAQPKKKDKKPGGTKVQTAQVWTAKIVPEKLGGAKYVQAAQAPTTWAKGGKQMVAQKKETREKKGNMRTAVSSQKHSTVTGYRTTHGVTREPQKKKKKGGGIGQELSLPGSGLRRQGGGSVSWVARCPLGQ